MNGADERVVLGPLKKTHHADREGERARPDDVRLEDLAEEERGVGHIRRQSIGPPRKTLQESCEGDHDPHGRPESTGGPKKEEDKSIILLSNIGHGPSTVVPPLVDPKFFKHA